MLTFRKKCLEEGVLGLVHGLTEVPGQVVGVFVHETRDRVGDRASKVPYSGIIVQGFLLFG